MKTNYFSSVKSMSVYSLIGLISILMASCGSYKNNSYYDKDGIYESGESGKDYKAENRNSDKYKEYFSSLREDNQQGEVFTDVENYSTNKDTINSNKSNNTESYSTGYAGWGNNQQPINVTIYDNNWGWNNYGYGTHWNYGWNWNLGWNSWYRPSIGYGWGWNNWYGPNYGYNYYGYNNYYNGYYNNYYSPYYNGHYNNYSYSNGIRGRSSGRVGGRYDLGITDTGNRINSSVRGSSVYNGIRNSNGITPRRNETSTPRNEISNPRSYTPTRSENSTPRNYTPTRLETPSPRSESYTPRSYSPTRSESSAPRSENYSTPRSYSPSSNSGGGYGGSSGGGSGGGGGRSSGGSGGRR